MPSCPGTSWEYARGIKRPFAYRCVLQVRRTGRLGPDSPGAAAAAHSRGEFLLCGLCVAVPAYITAGTLTFGVLEHWNSPMAESINAQTILQHSVSLTLS